MSRWKSRRGSKGWLLPSIQSHSARKSNGLGKLIDPRVCARRSGNRVETGEMKEGAFDNNIFNDPKMKLLIFTEHKDTLDYLAGDGKDGRPLGKLRQVEPKTTQIHGGMKIGDRDTPGSRIYAEREFRDDAQVLVATEAAGEGINLQFCWFMVNYDIPWNPVRLEQRMGRIHRYGQEQDCLIFNFVAINTREGRVLPEASRTITRDSQRAGEATTRFSMSSARSSPRTCSKSFSARCMCAGWT